METIYPLFLCANPLLGSYPTYEEWKLCISFTGFKLCVSSYPTYEEWKLTSLITSICYYHSSSYPTYEEWKRSQSFHTHL